MSRLIFQLTAVAVFLLAGTGCEQQSTTESPSSDADSVVVEPSASDPTAETSPSDGDETPASVELKIATFDELQASIAESKGKIVVVDYWSTQCPPCMTEFPGLVAIHNDLPSSQVRCISASLDYEGLPDFPIEEARKSALEFLEQKEATLDNFILSEDSLTVMDEKLKIASIPAVFVFGVDGKLARLFDESSGESFTYEKDITPFVKELVAKSFSDQPSTADQE